MAKKQIIIMDEVDGMAGGDRGGVAQLISFIKKTQVSRGKKVMVLVSSCNVGSGILELKYLFNVGPHHLHLQRSSVAKSEIVGELVL